MVEDDERELVARLRLRDEAAFNGFVRAHQDRVFGLAVRLLGDRSEAEDVTQEVFVAVFRALPGFRGESKLSTWLYRVTTNHCRNRIKYLARRARPGRTDPDELLEQLSGDGVGPLLGATVPRPDQLVEGHEMERAVQLALADLEPAQLELIVLRDIEQLAYEEIVKLTGLPEGTVKSRLHRARLALEERVGQLSTRRSDVPEREP